MPSTQHDETVGTNLYHRIIISQSSQNQYANTSEVRVRGQLVNASDYRVWNEYGNISRSITGNQSYNPGDFGFDTAPHTTYTYIDHTFTCTHDADGTKSVGFTTHYGDTGVGFDGPSASGDSLTLTRIPKRPDPPGQPVFSNITPTSLTVSWSASPDNNGSPITTYRLRRWTGPTQSGPYTDSDASGLSRNVSSLIPGTIYTFAVQCRNGSADNGGWSNWGTDNHIQLLGGVRVRYGGAWVRAIPYVRSGGTWHLATPYVRSGGTWHLTD